MKKKDIVITTVAVTTLMLMAAIGFNCSELREDDTQSTFVEKQIDDENIAMPIPTSIQRRPADEAYSTWSDFKKESEKEANVTEATGLENETETQDNIVLDPVVLSYNKVVELNVGEKLALDMLDIQLELALEVEYSFNKTPFKKVGEFEEVVKVTDKSTGAYTELLVSVKVSDSTAPKIKGAKDITIIEGEKLDLLKGVSAKDNVDGDLTSKIKVSNYDSKKLDKKQKIVYTVKDKSGNVAKKEITLLIKSNPVKKLDKYMYATSSVNVRDSSSAKGKKVGSLSYAQRVHVTGQDKDTGWYRIEYNGKGYWVSNSYLSDTKPKVKTPSNNGSGKSNNGSGKSNNGSGKSNNGSGKSGGNKDCIEIDTDCDDFHDCLGNCGW